MGQGVTRTAGPTSHDARPQNVPVGAEERPRLPRLALRPLAGIAAAVVIVLVAFAGRYGYHGDELYFLVAGRHLSWGYPDLPPFVPLLARLLSDLAPGSLVLLRLPSALAAGTIVVLTALTCRELGGERAAQLLAAAVMAAGGLVLAAAHLLSTTSFDLLFWTLLVFLVVRVLRTGNDRLWLLVGAVAGIGLLNKDLVAFLAVAVVVGLALGGPRGTLASPWLWAGALIAGLLWTPYLLWQAQHGWPELAVARAIAAGRSGTSEPRSLFLPLQLALLSPYLAPAWIAGLVRLFRDARLRWCRSLGWAWVLLAVTFVVTGGKPYYLGGLTPVLVGAGATPTIAWMRRRHQRLRRAAAVVALTLAAVETVVVAVPVVPVGVLHRTPLPALNNDTAQTVGWPTYVREIAAVYRRLPASQRAATVVLGSSYAEAGAVERFGPALGLPQAFSGQDGFWYWGPPPAGTKTVVAVGFGRAFLERSFATVRLAARLDNHLGVDNDQNAPVWVCSRARAGWHVLWPRFRYWG